MHCQILFEGIISFAVAAAFAALILSTLIAFGAGLHGMYLKSFGMYMQSANAINASIAPFADFRIIIQK